MVDTLDEIRNRAIATGERALSRYRRARDIGGITLLLALGAGYAAHETAQPGLLLAAIPLVGVTATAGIQAMRRSHEAAAAQQVLGQVEIQQALLAAQPPAQM